MSEAERLPKVKRPQPGWVMALRALSLIAGVFTFGMSAAFGTAVLTLSVLLLALAAVPYRWYPRRAPKLLVAVAEPGPVVVSEVASSAQESPTRFYVADDGHAG